MSTELESDLVRTLIDPGQLEQILVNLAVNARDAMPGGGRLTIRTKSVVVDDVYATSRPNLEPGCYVQLSVSDTGVGMTADVLQRVFEPFFTTKTKDQGTGLGLAMVYGIATQAGGDVSIYSEPGLGTTVSVLLPESTSAPSPSEPAADVDDLQGSGQLILVVDDEDALREVSRRVLHRAGYRVLVAASGDDALAVLEGAGGAIDLLLTDVIMPNMGGKELVETLAAQGQSVEVIFMSGYAEPLSAGTLSPETRATILSKPFTAAELLKRVAAVLRR